MIRFDARFGPKRKWLSANSMSALPSKADIVRLVGHVQRMSQADNAAPNSIAIYGFTGSLVTPAPGMKALP